MQDKIRVKKLVTLAFLIALAVVFTRFLSLRITLGGVEGIRIGFGGFPIIVAGIIFGPVAGGIVGALADVLGFIISPMGAYMPHFTLTAALTGILPGLVFNYLSGRKTTFLNLVIAIGIGQVVSSVILVPFFLQILFGIPFKATFIPKIIGQFIHIPLYAYFMRILMRILISRDILAIPETNPVSG